MTDVTDVTYGSYDFDEYNDEMLLTLYVIPAENYRPGLPEEEARELGKPARYVSAPGYRGIENYVRDAAGNPTPNVTSCGHGHTWHDGLITSRTPVPAGRCPWEHLPDVDEDDAHEVPTVEFMAADGAARAFADAGRAGDLLSGASFTVRVTINPRVWTQEYGEDEDPNDLADWARGALLEAVPHHLRGAVLVEVRERSRHYPRPKS